MRSAPLFKLSGKWLSFSFPGPVFDGATLGIGHRLVVFSFFHPELRLQTGFFVENVPNRGRLIATMLLIRERLKGAVKGERKGDGNCRRFLVSHGADRVIRKMAGQEDSMLTKCMIQSYT